jgi:hypothetical protein
VHVPQQALAAAGALMKTSFRILLMKGMKSIF